MTKAPGGDKAVLPVAPVGAAVSQPRHAGSTTPAKNEDGDAKSQTKSVLTTGADGKAVTPDPGEQSQDSTDKSKGGAVAGNQPVMTPPVDTSGKPSDAAGAQGKKVVPAGTGGVEPSAPLPDSRKGGAADPLQPGSDGQRGKVAGVKSKSGGKSKSVEGGAVAPPPDDKVSLQTCSKQEQQGAPKKDTTNGKQQVVGGAWGCSTRKRHKTDTGREEEKGTDGKSSKGGVSKGQKETGSRFGDAVSTEGW